MKKRKDVILCRAKKKKRKSTQDLLSCLLSVEVIKEALIPGIFIFFLFPC